MMRSLFSPEGVAALSAIMARRPLLAFDFDGTLAPIVARPDDARVPLALAQRLHRLSAILSTAIITGRSVADVRGRLAFEPQFIIGNHGAEDPSSAPSTIPAVLDGLRARLRYENSVLTAAGVTVEDKIFSIALHYRSAHDRALALATITHLLDSRAPGLKIFGGKLVVNVMSADGQDKAQAVASLVQRCGAQSAFFVGDDVNDEPVFARLEPTWLTVKVGCEHPSSKAMFCVNGPDEMVKMLDRMLMLLDESSP